MKLSLKGVKSNAETHCLVLHVEARTGVHVGVLLPIHFAPLPHQVHAKNLDDSAVRQPDLGQIWTASNEYETTQTLPSKPFDLAYANDTFQLLLCPFCFRPFDVSHNLSAPVHYYGGVHVWKMTNMPATCLEHSEMIKRLLQDCAFEVLHLQTRAEQYSCNISRNHECLFSIFNVFSCLNWKMQWFICIEPDCRLFCGFYWVLDAPPPHPHPAINTCLSCITFVLQRYIWCHKKVVILLLVTKKTKLLWLTVS